MTVTLEVPDSEGLYATVSVSSQPKAAMRIQIHRLGRLLSEAVRRRLAETDRVLCVVILRGGALLYPSFAAELDDADFCMLGLRRVGSGVVSEYSTGIPDDTYDRVIYLDCVAATGGTILAARRAIAQACDTGEETAAVICSATTATRALHGAGVNVIGFSLAEAESSGIVTPDLGELDAGDLFTSTGNPPLAARSPGAATYRARPV